jgi:hypothetical protein
MIRLLRSDNCFHRIFPPWFFPIYDRWLRLFVLEAKFRQVQRVEGTKRMMRRATLQKITRIFDQRYLLPIFKCVSCSSLVRLLRYLVPVPSSQQSLLRFRSAPQRRSHLSFLIDGTYSESLSSSLFEFLLESLLSELPSSFSELEVCLMLVSSKSGYSSLCSDSTSLTWL